MILEIKYFLSCKSFDSLKIKDCIDYCNSVVNSSHDCGSVHTVLVWSGFCLASGPRFCRGSRVVSGQAVSGWRVNPR